MGQTPGGTLTLTGLDGREEEVAFDQTKSPFQAQIEAFAESVLAGEPFPFPPEADLHTMRLVEACGAGGREGVKGKREEGASGMGERGNGGVGEG